MDIWTSLHRCCGEAVGYGETYHLFSARLMKRQQRVGKVVHVLVARRRSSGWDAGDRWWPSQRDATSHKGVSPASGVTARANRVSMWHLSRHVGPLARPSYTLTLSPISWGG